MTKSQQYYCTWKTYDTTSLTINLSESPNISRVILNRFIYVRHHLVVLPKKVEPVIS